ncbi:DNA-binding protein [Sphingobacterium sp. MYb388]|uniref:DNA-binding protein n=1 Tax=Sphingobacterium sp. MYb388 TaxID=2745437 RepID=UPI0030AEA458
MEERKKSQKRRNDLLTIGDWEDYKLELITEIKELLKERNIANKKWLKTHEVLKLLRISPGNLQQLRSRKIIPYTPIGGLFCYYEEDMMGLLERYKTSI